MGRNIPAYDFKGFVPYLLARGTFSKVIIVSPERVAKLRGKMSGLDGLEMEIEMQEKLLRAGISVPKPYGISRFDFEGESKEGIEMDWVRGESVDQMNPNSNNFQKACKLLWKELDKARQAGLINEDMVSYNAIYSPCPEKITLIDFQFWIDTRTN